MKIFTHKYITYNLLIISILLFILGCAQEMTPTGGAKDTQPPIALKSKPVNQQPNFIEKTISITFDEYIVLKDVTSQILISPPINPKPTFTTKGKSVVINLKDSKLQPNTTYNIFFGEAIQDLHEGNIIPDFHYIFSTGNTIDSLSYSGTIIDAFTNRNFEGATVMLYSTENDTIPIDSLPYKKLPQYICKSKKDGSFMFYNLKPENYKIFALKDENRNFLFDLPNESIAFSETFVSPYYIENEHSHNHSQKQDSTEKDIEHENHSQILDTIETDNEHENNPKIKMLLFKEFDSTMRLLDVKIIDTIHAQLYFSYTTTNPTFKLVSPQTDDENWMYEEWSTTKDTLFAWFPSHISDTLQIEFSNNDKIIDTVSVALKQPTKPRKNEKTETQKNPVLKITSNSTSIFPFFNTLQLSLSSPLHHFDFECITFTVNSNTIKTPPLTYNKDYRNLFFDYQFKEETKYTIDIPKGTFTDIIGLTNDSTKISFTTDLSSKYGTLKLNISIPENTPQIIVQLMTEDEKTVIQEKIIDQNQSINFGYLSPKKVKIKAIFDTNKNGKWDTGNYFYKIQPEQTLFFEKTIEIKAYWDAEENWDIKPE